MKISRVWLQKYFEKELPSAVELADALTFHAFEIESVENDILDVKITPNRGHDCLSHRGIAKEISAILDLPLVRRPYAVEDTDLKPSTSTVSVKIENAQLCRRFTGAHIKGIRVGPSPAWLRDALEGVGQRSINNIVDITNYVMLDTGQPLHAFDMSKLKSPHFSVRLARSGEKLVGLDDKEYTLIPSMLAIENGGEVVSIAGIKGGKSTGIDESTSEMILEAANWDGVTIRRTSQALKLRTDASDRFQQVISPELAPYGMKVAAEMIREIAGGEIVGYIDEYPAPQKPWSVSVSLKKINAVLGTQLPREEVARVFQRLSFSMKQSGDDFEIEVPFDRLDLQIPEDLIEEVGRIIGYDKIASVDLPPIDGSAAINGTFAAAEKIREDLMAKGYSEVYTSVFADKGERVVANKVDGVRPYLRGSLIPGLTDALTRNVRNKDLLGLKEVKLFEIGTVWKKDSEQIVVGTSGEKEKADETALASFPVDSYETFPISETDRYQSFSKYPFIVRDIALWVPNGTSAEDALNLIRSQAGDFLVRSELFDRFEKEGKISYAFRLIFQSFERTLTDAEVFQVMEKVTNVITHKGWEVR